MPVSSLQHRDLTGVFQNKSCVSAGKNVQHSARRDSAESDTRDEHWQMGKCIRQIANSLDEPRRITAQSGHQREGIAAPLIMLLSQIRLADTPAVVARTIPVSGQTATPSDCEHEIQPAQSDSILGHMLHPVAEALYETGQFISKHDPLRFPVADASVIPSVASEKDIMYEIQNRSASNALFQALTGQGLFNTSGSEPMEPVILFYPASQELSREKRMAQDTQQQLQDIAYKKYISDNCHIRTRTNQGTVVGNNLLVTGETVRNPIRVAAELAYMKGGHPIPDWMTIFTESANLAYDVVLGIITFGSYPIVKYGSAKALKIAGHAANGDATCLKNEFTQEELANLLFDTEIGITNRYAFHSLPTPPRPRELKGVKSFVPDGVFVHESTANRLNTVKYMTVNHQGKEHYIKEKAPGEYWTFHPHAVNSAQVEKRVYFDAAKQKIHFSHEMPEGEGLDFDIVDGKKFIKVYNENHEVTWNWEKKRPEIVLNKENGERVYAPVYMEPLSKTWHLNTHNSREVFTKKQNNIIDRLKASENPEHNYFPEENNNRKYYGTGKTYRAEKKGDDSHYIQGRYVEMAGSLVPVRQKVTPGHGVHYEVYDIKQPNKNGLRIEWDGSRWIFEQSTSFHVSRDLKKHITADMYDKNVDAALLSAPDNHGLRWDVNSNTYLKVKDKYIKIKKLNGNRFVLNHPGGKHHRSILIFEKNKFRTENYNERLKNILTVGLGGRKRKTALNVLKEQDGFTEKSAKKLLSEYNFPEKGFFSDYSFALDVEQTGAVPLWAERFKKIPRINNSAHPAKKTTPVLLMKKDVPQNKITFNLGEKLGQGAYGQVFLDADDEIFVIKRCLSEEFDFTFDDAVSEVEMFNRYYGEGAATVLVDERGTPYIRMYRVPGIQIDSLPDNSLPNDAEQRLVDMIEKLNNEGIMHDDLHAGNILWDSESKTFFPVDISNTKNSYFDVNRKDKNELNFISEVSWDNIIMEIRKRKIKSQPKKEK